MCVSLKLWLCQSIERLLFRLIVPGGVRVSADYLSMYGMCVKRKMILYKMPLEMEGKPQHIDIYIFTSTPIPAQIISAYTCIIYENRFNIVSGKWNPTALYKVWPPWYRPIEGFWMKSKSINQIVHSVFACSGLKAF